MFETKPRPKKKQQVLWQEAGNKAMTRDASSETKLRRRPTRSFGPSRLKARGERQGGAERREERDMEEAREEQGKEREGERDEENKAKGEKGKGKGDGKGKAKAKEQEWEREPDRRWKEWEEDMGGGQAVVGEQRAEAEEMYEAEMAGQTGYRPAFQEWNESWIAPTIQKMKGGGRNMRRERLRWGASGGKG